MKKSKKKSRKLARERADYFLGDGKSWVEDTNALREYLTQLSNFRNQKKKNKARKDYQDRLKTTLRELGLTEKALETLEKSRQEEDKDRISALQAAKKKYEELARELQEAIGGDTKK